MPGCSVQVARSQLACRAHWYELPLEMRREVNASYRDKSAAGHSRHLTAVGAAYRWYLQQTDD